MVDMKRPSAEVSAQTADTENPKYVDYGDPKLAAFWEMNKDHPNVRMMTHVLHNHVLPNELFDTLVGAGSADLSLEQVKVILGANSSSHWTIEGLNQLTPEQFPAGLLEDALEAARDKARGVFRSREEDNRKRALINKQGFREVHPLNIGSIRESLLAGATASLVDFRPEEPKPVTGLHAQKFPDKSYGFEIAGEKVLLDKESGKPADSLPYGWLIKIDTE